MKGLDPKYESFALYGDLNASTYISYSDSFQSINLTEKERNPQSTFLDCEFGWSPEELMEYLDNIGVCYERHEVTENDIITEIYVEIAEPLFLFIFSEGKELDTFYCLEYGSRDGRIELGMEREDVELIFRESSEEELIYYDSDNDVTVVYEEDGIYYIINFSNDRVVGIRESNKAYERVVN